MFTDLETLALILAARAVDEQRRREHASRAVRKLGLDPRLEPLVPLPPRKRKLRGTYADALAMLQAVSQLPEPERTELIEEIFATTERGTVER